MSKQNITYMSLLCGLHWLSWILSFKFHCFVVPEMKQGWRVENVLSFEKS